MRSAPALSSRPPHARNSHARVAFNESLARRCADHRAKKAEDHGYLFYSAHSGWGNQQVALGQALQQRVESGEAAADDRQFKCVALGLGGGRGAPRPRVALGCIFGYFIRRIGTTHKQHKATARKSGRASPSARR